MSELAGEGKFDDVRKMGVRKWFEVNFQKAQERMTYRYWESKHKGLTSHLHLGEQAWDIDKQPREN